MLREILMKVGAKYFFFYVFPASLYYRDLSVFCRLFFFLFLPSFFPLHSFFFLCIFYFSVLSCPVVSCPVLSCSLSPLLCKPQIEVLFIPLLTSSLTLITQVIIIQKGANMVCHFLLIDECTEEN